MAIYNPNQKDEKKKGFLPFLSRMFDGASKTAGTIGSAGMKGASIGKAGIFASLFSTKAGVVGVLLGAATIAAGIGLVYNYLGTSSQSIYTPALFSDAYYQEAQKQANVERVSSQPSNPTESSLFKFAEAAQKELGTSDINKENLQNNEEANNNQYSSNEPPAVSEPSNLPQAVQNAAKLNANLGFNNAQGGGSSSSAPKLQTSGGLWSNMGKQFSPIGSSQAKMQTAAKSSNMNKSLSARLVASPKYQVPNINKKGAFGQAKFAGNVGKAAAYNISDAGARTTAEQAFSGETSGSGDVATPIGGTGLGGAGLSQGNKLKANDPALNMSEYTPPTPNKSTDTPWKKLTDYALYAMLASAGFIAIAALLSNKAKALLANPLTAPSAVGLFNAAKIFCYLAMAAAAVVIGIAVMLATKHGQKMMGLMYGLVGGALIYQAYKALTGINEGLDKAKQAGQFVDTVFKNMNQGQQAAFKAMPADKQWSIINGFDYNAYQANKDDYVNTLLNLK